VQRERGRILDAFYLLCAAVLVCVLGGRAFPLAHIYKVNPLLVLYGLISVGFFAGAREDYRKQFRSPRFNVFACCWVVIDNIDTESDEGLNLDVDGVGFVRRQ